jgi:hypothetical protein
VLLVSNREINVLPDLTQNFLCSFPGPNELLNGYYPFFTESLNIPDELIETAMGNPAMATTIRLHVAHFVREFNENIGKKNSIIVCANR